MNRFAVILTHNRPELLRQTWQAIGPQVDMVIIMDNASDPPVNYQQYHALEWKTAVVTVPDQPPNLARLWGHGIKLAETIRQAGDEELEDGFYVAMLCDDVLIPDGWFKAVTDVMTLTGAVVGCSGHGTRVKTEPDSNLVERMPGHAWILDPVSTVRPDESMAWWWCDTDIDWQARKSGGMVMVDGYAVHNVHPNDWTVRRPELAEQAGQDGLTFVAKWGWRPW